MGCLTFVKTCSLLSSEVLVGRSVVRGDSGGAESLFLILSEILEG